MPLDHARVMQLATELMKCVKKDQSVKAKFLMKGLRRKDKQRIVSQVSIKSKCQTSGHDSV